MLLSREQNVPVGAASSAGRARKAERKPTVTDHEALITKHCVHEALSMEH
jgi:hypothetical protein